MRIQDLAPLQKERLYKFIDECLFLTEEQSQALWQKICKRIKEREKR